MRFRHALLLAAVLAAPLSAGAVTRDAASPDPLVRLEFVRDAGRPFGLSAPRPNPFTSATRFELTLEEGDQITVSVHDALGRRVALLQDGQLRAGTYALSLNANQLPPGLYLIRATDGRGATATRSVALTR